jgi:6-bladed beta-propeller
MKTNIWAAISCLMIIFCLPACKGKTPMAKVETIEGVTYIHNTAAPLHPKKKAFFEEELIYQDKDATGEVRLFQPGRIAVDAKENAYITDSSDMAIKVFDPQGQYLREIGRKGEGPGEFTDIGEIVPLSDGRLLVTDSLARRTSFFGPGGQFLSSFAWKKLSGRSSSEGFILFPTPRALLRSRHMKRTPGESGLRRSTSWVKN